MEVAFYGCCSVRGCRVQGLQYVAFIVCRGHGVRELWCGGLRSRGVAVSGGCGVWGCSMSWRAYRLNFHQISVISIFADFPLGFCYGQTSEPRTLWMDLKDAHSVDYSPMNFKLHLEFRGKGASSIPKRRLLKKYRSF